jgi:parallel beta-helix repeat protein
MTHDRDRRPDPQPDHETEGRVNAWLTDTDLTPHEAQRGLRRLLDDFPVTPQTRRRFLGRWFDRDEGARRRATDHDHPPKVNRRKRLMLSATGITAALAIFALAVNVSVTDPAPAPPGAGDGITHVVNADGSGDFTTITDAIAAAADGDTVTVQPGTYTESVVIDKDIALRGDGPVEDIVIDLADAVLITLSDSDAEIADLTLRGDDFTQGMVVLGGAPTIRGVVFDGTGIPFNGHATCSSVPETCGGGSLAIDGGEARVLDSRFLGGGEVSVHSDANALFDGNELIDGPHLYLAEPGPDTVVRDNQISGTRSRAIGLYGPGRILIEGNSIMDAGGEGISVGYSSAPGYEPIIRDNRIEGTTTAIDVVRGASPTVEGNTLTDNRAAIYAGGGAGTYISNTIDGNGQGLVVTHGSATLDGNEIRNNDVGLAGFGADTIPVLTANTICDNEVNVNLGSTMPPLTDDGSNEICEDASAE